MLKAISSSPLRIGGAVVALILVGVVVWVLRLYWSTPKPPPVKMPTPNAYDYYVAAGRMLRDADKIQFALNRRAPPPGTSVNPYNRVYTLEEKTKLVSENGSALAKLREGFRFECRHPADRTWMPLHPEHSDFDTVARLLAVESLVRQADGDLSGAVSSCTDAIRLGYDICRGGTWSAAYAGRAAQSIGEYRLLDLIPKLGAGQAQSAARRLEEVRAAEVPYAEMLTEEKWAGLAAMDDLRRRDSPSGPEGWAGRLTLQIACLGQAHEYSHYLDQCIANARLPYAAKPPRPAGPEDIPIGLAGGPLEAFWCAWKRTGSSMLNVMVAVRAYQAQHGQYPASLSKLTPRYLKRVPDDPFAMKGPLGFRTKGASYILYSIGPDGKDDGGQPVDEVATRWKSFKPAQHSPGWTPKVLASSESRFRVDENSKGDIVAGINVLSRTGW